MNMIQKQNESANQASKNSPPMPHVSRQAVAGVMAPQTGEAIIRECRPTVAAYKRLAGLAKFLQQTPPYILAPLGWLILGPLFAFKFLPFTSRRYTLTNRQVMIRRGFSPKPLEGVLLEDIEDVRLVPDSFDDFYFCGDLVVQSQGKVALTLLGVPEPEGFRQAILNAARAWAPGKMKIPFQPASAIK